MVTAALVAAAVLLVGSLYASARGFACNRRRWRDARRRAPLDGVDLTGARVGPVPTPPGWPGEAEITDPAVAAGYAAVAVDRIANRVLLGEVSLVTAGALLGSVMEDLIRLEPIAVAGALIAVALLGSAVVARVRVTRYWAPIEARYARRYEELTAQPAPAPATWRDRLLGRMLGQTRRTAQEPRSGRPM